MYTLSVFNVILGFVLGAFIAELPERERERERATYIYALNTRMNECVYMAEFLEQIYCAR